MSIKIASQKKIVLLLSILQYFSLGFYDAKQYIPIIIALFIISLPFNNEIFSQFKIYSWGFFLMTTLFIYFIRSDAVNMELPQTSGLILLSLLFFLNYPKDKLTIAYLIFSFSLGVSLRYLHTVLFTAIENDFALLYGKLHVYADNLELITSHISFYLTFSLYSAGTLISFIRKPSFKLALIIFFLIILLCLFILGNRVFIVAVILLFLFYGRLFKYMSLSVAILFTISFLELPFLGNYLEFTYSRFENTFSDGERNTLWVNGIRLSLENIFGYNDMLQEIGYNSYHNIVLDSWRFGGIILTFSLTAIFVFELFHSLKVYSMSKINRFIFFYILFLTTLFQLEVIFEQLYRLIPLYVLACQRFKLNNNDTFAA
jgi:hypothetical protein